MADAIRAVYPVAGEHPRISVEMLFKGDGTIERVTVDGGIPASMLECIERAARVAHVPAFNGSSFRATFAL